MVIERITPGYYYLDRNNEIKNIPSAIIGTGQSADRHFEKTGALGWWYVTGSLDYNHMLREVSKLRGKLKDKGVL